MGDPKLPTSGASGPGMSDEEFMAALTGGVKSPDEFAKWARKEARRIAFVDGKYSVRVPDVAHAPWSMADWMRWIDACDGWHDKSLRDPL